MIMMVVAVVIVFLITFVCCFCCFVTGGAGGVGARCPRNAEHPQLFHEWFTVCKTCFELISCDLSFLYIQIGSTNKNTVNIHSICPPANSHHQDYYMFSIWKLKLNLYLPAS